MGKFAIECPKCGSVNTASSFIFAKKVISCGACSCEINVKESRLISKVCPHCGKVFVYDQAKTANKTCPSCGQDINAIGLATAVYKMVPAVCPQCSCAVEIDATKDTFFCPVCDFQMNVNQTLEKAKLVSDTGVSVIKYEGDNSTFVWKHPIEDFNMGSLLIVHETQEAVFFLNGEALDTFGPGRHTLETENLPALRRIYSLPDGSQTPFHAEIYFINKTVQMGMKWGTDSRVRFIDPVTGIPLDIGASGEMNLQVSDSRKLLFKLVGTANGLTNKEVLSSISDSTDIVHRTLKSYFRAPLMTAVKSYLAAVIKEQQINILEIDEHLSTLSDALHERISPKFEEYGLVIPEFYVTSIALPEDDRNFQDIRALISQAYIGVKSEEVRKSVAEASRQRQLVEEQTRVQLQVIQAQADAEALRARGLAEAEVMRAKGYTEKDVLEAEVQKAYAEGMGQMGSNGEGSSGGGMASELVGMVAGMKMASTMFDKMDNIRPSGKSDESDKPETASVPTWTCSCGESGNTKKFCMSCGKPKPEIWDCPVCGHKGNRGKFCEECGTAKSETWSCPICGAKENKGKFCAECGAPKPDKGGAE